MTADQVTNYMKGNEIHVQMSRFNYFTQIDVSFLCVCPVIDHEFRHNIVKVAVDPRGDSRVDPQTTLTML